MRVTWKLPSGLAIYPGWAGAFAFGLTGCAAEGHGAAECRAGAVGASGTWAGVGCTTGCCGAA